MSNEMITCPWCNSKIARGGLKDHAEKCKERPPMSKGDSSLVKEVGPIYGKSARKPSLDELDRVYE